jgi:hypothetical protein
MLYSSWGFIWSLKVHRCRRKMQQQRRQGCCCKSRENGQMLLERWRSYCYMCPAVVCVQCQFSRDISPPPFVSLAFLSSLNNTFILGRREISGRQLRPKARSQTSISVAQVRALFLSVSLMFGCRLTCMRTLPSRCIFFMSSLCFVCVWQW